MGALAVNALDALALRVGRLIRLSDFRAIFDDGVGYASYSAPRGEVFVLSLLGTEPKKMTAKGAKNLDLVAAMAKLGWYRGKDVEKMIREALVEERRRRKRPSPVSRPTRIPRRGKPRPG